MSNTTHNIGVTERVWDDTARQRIIVVTIWYPTPVPLRAITYLTSINSWASRDAACEQKKFPLLLISHGSAGHRYNQYYLAEFLTRFGYIVVSIQHPFDNAFDDSCAKEIDNLWHRPRDVSFVLDQVLADKKLSHYIDKNKIAVLGHSFGGYTALVLIGAVPDYYHLKNIFNNKKAIEQYDFRMLKESRIKCIFIMAPALAHLFTIIHLKRIAIPVFIVVSGKDEILKGIEKNHLAMLSSKQDYLEFAEAGHYVYLMEASTKIKNLAANPWVDVGTPRHLIHPILQQKCLEFFEQHLKHRKI